MLLLPGMGADARLFDGLRPLPFTVPPWPDPDPADTLQAYAVRVASVLSERPSVIGGASFGGMVALEMAALTRPKAVILVGSCTSPSAIAPSIQDAGPRGRPSAGAGLSSPSVVVAAAAAEVR